MTEMAPWAPVVIDLGLAVLPGDDWTLGPRVRGNDCGLTSLRVELLMISGEEKDELSSDKRASPLVTSAA